MKKSGWSGLVVAGLVGTLLSCAPQKIVQATEDSRLKAKRLDQIGEDSQPRTQTVSVREMPVDRSRAQHYVKINDEGWSIEDTFNLMDDYYQTLFMDEELTSEGIFGANRLIMSKIDAHGAKQTDPGYLSKKIKSQVFVFGNKGKSLNPATVALRYQRLENPIDYESLMPGQGGEPKRLPQHKFEMDSLIKAAATKSLRGESGPFSHESNGWTLQIRRVNLSKSECLPCHKDMKIGEPVALMAYLAIKAPATR